MDQIAAAQPRWSTAVEEAAWLADSLAPAADKLVGSVVPPGYQAYARLLHPVRRRLAKSMAKVRWAEVAAWSGVRLAADSQFHSIALPAAEPAGPAPWDSQGPDRGSLPADDALALAEVLGWHTGTPESCLFCLWDGWDWGTAMCPAYPAFPGEPLFPLPDPVPAQVRDGPRVSLGGRDYLLYTGPVEAALTFAAAPDQTPNLWWPADRAWCVASDVDLCWTYVGGSAELISELTADERLEALPAAAGQPCSRIEESVLRSAERAAAELVTAGRAIIATTGGTVTATLQGPGRRGAVGRALPRLGYPRAGRGVSLKVHAEGRNGLTSRAEHRLDAPNDTLAAQAARYLALAVTGLVEG